MSSWDWVGLIFTHLCTCPSIQSVCVAWYSAYLIWPFMRLQINLSKFLWKPMAKKWIIRMLWGSIVASFFILLPPTPNPQHKTIHKVLPFIHNIISESKAIIQSIYVRLRSWFSGSFSFFFVETLNASEVQSVVHFVCYGFLSMDDALNKVNCRISLKRTTHQKKCYYCYCNVNGLNK